MRRAPCLRAYSHPSPAVLALLGDARAPPEDFCAAELASLCAAALRHAAGARARGLAAALAAAGKPVPVGEGLTRLAAAAVDGAQFGEALREAGLLGSGGAESAPAPLRIGPGGIILDTRSPGGGYGALGGVGQWAVLRYSEAGLAEELITLFAAGHFRGGSGGAQGGRQGLAEEHAAAMRRIAAAYSKVSVPSGVGGGVRRLQQR